MGYHIQEILLSEDRYINYKIHDATEMKISNLSKINIFVGTNNSGKSRMLRSLSSEEDLLFSPASFELHRLNELIESFKTDLITVLDSKRITAYGSLRKEDIEVILPYSFIKESDNFLYEIQNMIENINKINGSPSATSVGYSKFDLDHEAIQSVLKDIATTFQEEIKDFSKKKVLISNAFTSQRLED